MFTGIVEEVGRVVGTQRRGGSLILVVEAPGVAEGLAEGDSIAVNGVCTTVERAVGLRFRVTTVAETLRRTTLGRLRVGGRVNLERALVAGSRIGGHFVQGHVDGVARVVSFVQRGEQKMLSLRLPGKMASGVVEKGSIAVDGMSLTVAAVRGNIVEAAIVPFTLAHTIARDYRAGTEVNVELDVLGKYATDRDGRKR